MALLECDHVDPALREVAGDYADMFDRLFAAHAPAVEIHRVDVIGGAPLPALDAFDGLLIGGSRHSVGDPLPWIERLSGLVRAAHAAGVPLVGICFGHQLIARALGGRVERAAGGWGVGVHRATVTEGRPWMAPPRDGYDLLVSHQDQVVELPPDGRLLATSPHARVAAFGVGSSVGFQGHPEFAAPYALALLQARADRIPAAAIDAATATLGDPTDGAVLAGWISDALGARQVGRTR